MSFHACRRCRGQGTIDLRKLDFPTSGKHNYCQLHSTFKRIVHFTNFAVNTATADKVGMDCASPTLEVEQRLTHFLNSAARRSPCTHARTQHSKHHVTREI